MECIFASSMYFCFPFLITHFHMAHGNDDDAAPLYLQLFEPQTNHIDDHSLLIFTDTHFSFVACFVVVVSFAHTKRITTSEIKEEKKQMTENSIEIWHQIQTRDAIHLMAHSHACCAHIDAVSRIASISMLAQRTSQKWIFAFAHHVPARRKSSVTFSCANFIICISRCKRKVFTFADWERVIV